MTLIAAILIAVLPPYQATVISVHDGDTVIVKTGDGPTTDTTHIRLSGIDAPELKQPMGEKSKVALSDMVFGKVIEVIPEGSTTYDRQVATIKLDGQDICLKMVATGNAWWYERYAKHDMRLANAQAKAKADRLGIWATTPQPPWEWRRTRGDQKKEAAK